MAADRLTVEQEIAVVFSVVPAHALLGVARGPDNPAASLRMLCGTGGGSEAGAGVGSYCYDSKGVSAGYTGEGWSMSWPRAAAVLMPGLTPGVAVGLSWGYRRLTALHADPWESEHTPPWCDGGYSTTATSDPLAYWLVWWPEYRAAHRTIAAAVDAWRALSLAALRPPPAAAEQLGLFAAAAI